MDLKGFVPVIALLLVAGVLAIGGIWYFENHGVNVNSGSIVAIERNARFLLGANQNGKQYTIGVYASNETSSLSDDDCANGAHEEYQGNYELETITDNTLVATTGIGEYDFTPFVEPSILTSTNSGVIFVLVPQYATCNGNFDFLYAMDDRGTFKQVAFINQQGASGKSVFVSDNLIDMNNNLLNVDYYNNAGTSTVGDYDDTYSYDASNTRFLFAASAKK